MPLWYLRTRNALEVRYKNRESQSLYVQMLRNLREKLNEKRVTEKRELMVIRKIIEASCFKNDQKLPIQFRPNNKTWIMAELLNT